jgi:hypothetical protein
MLMITAIIGIATNLLSKSESSIIKSNITNHPTEKHTAPYSNYSSISILRVPVNLKGILHY